MGNRRSRRWIGWSAILATVIILVSGTSFVSRFEANMGWIFLSRSLDPESANLSSAERWFQSSNRLGNDERSHLGLTQVYLKAGETKNAIRNWVEGGHSSEEALLLANDYMDQGKWEKAHAWYILADGIECTGTQCAVLKERIRTVANPEFNWSTASQIVGDRSDSDVVLGGWSIFDQATPANPRAKTFIGAHREADSTETSLLVNIPDSSLDVVVQSNPIIVIAGQEIEVQSWGKRDSSTTAARLEVQFLTKDGQHVSYGPSSSVSPINEWQVLDLSAVAPANAGWFVIRLRAFTELDSKGQAEFDKISILVSES